MKIPALVFRFVSRLDCALMGEYYIDLYNRILKLQSFVI